MESFLNTYVVVFAVIFAVVSFILLVTGLGGGEIFASSLKNEDFDSIFGNGKGCLEYLIGTAIIAFVITVIVSLCGLTGR